jgi:hypothetical protein
VKDSTVCHSLPQNTLCNIEDSRRISPLIFILILTIHLIKKIKVIEKIKYNIIYYII